jgi:hypothetical protein
MATSMHEFHSENWLRVHRDLLHAERAYDANLRQFEKGLLPNEDLVRARRLLDAKRAVAQAVTNVVLGDPPVAALRVDEDKA